MRLWQKIFLLTLVFATLAVNSVSFMLLIRSQNNSLILARDNAHEVCEKVTSEIEQSFRVKKARTGSLILSSDQIANLLETVVSQSDFDGEIICSPIEARYASVGQLSDGADVFQTKYMESDHLIRTETTIFLEGRFYRVSITTEISKLIEQFDRDLKFAQWFGGTVALITAVALLVASLVLTNPLNRLKTATEQIAHGNYQDRITMRGHDEISELSQYMNKMSEEIEAYILKIEQISKNQETFIANMTHEMKTPLTSILGFADVLIIKSNLTEDERREYASIIAAEAKRLRLLSSKLMELISIKETELPLQPMNIKAVVERAMETFSPLCEERQCSLQSELQPVMIDADEALFTSLVLNLLDNALKASEHGGIIHVSLNRENDRAVLQIQDHGIGIPQEQLGYVTEAFYMVGKARSRSSGGAGIGLSLCKAIAEAHHGTLEIDSRENSGTTVTLIFPISKKGRTV